MRLTMLTTRIMSAHAPFVEQLEFSYTESDVEQKVILPLLTSSELLGISHDLIRSKTYLAPTAFDKKAGKNVVSVVRTFGATRGVD